MWLLHFPSGKSMDQSKDKKPKIEAGEDGKDRLSNLPDALITRILSHLPIKEAVRTSVLSTKWERKWMAITNISLDDSLLNYGDRRFKKAYFMNVVDNILLRIGSSSIEDFSLACRGKYPECRVSTWISAVIRHRVQRLDICLLENEPFTLPRCLMTSDSLRDLRLDGCCQLKVPSSTRFSSLKFLSLERVTIFYLCGTADSTEILLQFPVLEHFSCRDCKWLNLKVVSIDSPALKNFTMRSSSAFMKMRRLDYPLDLKFNIYAIDLTTLVYYGDFSEEFTLPTPLGIVDADVNVGYDYISSNLNWERQLGLRAYTHLQKLSGVRYLTLVALTFKGVTETEEGSLTMVPKCIVSSLKFIKIRHFDAKGFDSLNFLLKHARVLETIHITFIESWKLKQRQRKKIEKFKMKILAMPKRSRSAKFIFSLEKFR
ncbi:FBD domain [Dillenia turbinata]|uniref:FBD domain n=1 Tax=Dillenia turbinata TaxID=194707 RepID=A0AAN8ZBV3_9MAGN